MKVINNKLWLSIFYFIMILLFLSKIYNNSKLKSKNSTNSKMKSRLQMRLKLQSYMKYKKNEVEMKSNLKNKQIYEDTFIVKGSDFLNSVKFYLSNRDHLIMDR